MFHLLAFLESHDNVANQDLTPVPDSIFTIQNAHFVPQVDHYLYAAMFSALTAERCRIVTPAVRQITRPYIRNINPNLLPITLMPVADYRMEPLIFKGLEELAVEATHTTGGGTFSTVLLAVNKTQLEPPPAGQVYTMRGTSPTAAAADVWSNIAVVWEDTLPVGTYAVVGFQCISTNSLAARLIFEDQWYRPGVVGCVSNDNQHPPIFQKGGMGVYGRFNANRMPNVEVLAHAADATHELYLDFVRIG